MEFPIPLLHKVTYPSLTWFACFNFLWAYLLLSSFVSLTCMGIDVISLFYFVLTRHLPVGPATELYLLLRTSTSFSEKCFLVPGIHYVTPAGGRNLPAPDSISFTWATSKIVIFFTCSVVAFPSFTITMLTIPSNANTFKVGRNKNSRPILSSTVTSGYIQEHRLDCSKWNNQVIRGMAPLILLCASITCLGRIGLCFIQS